MGVHDTFFKDIFVNTDFAAEIFRKVFTPQEFAYFNWKTLRVEGTVWRGYSQLSLSFAQSSEHQKLGEKWLDNRPYFLYHGFYMADEPPDSGKVHRALRGDRR